ncbi:putative reverse transcriptase domain-containing protein [Tanacetum coccineum]
MTNYRVLKKEGVYILIAYGIPAYRLRLLRESHSWDIKLHVIDKLLKGENSKLDTWELTHPVPLNSDRSLKVGSPLENMDVHYIYVCPKGVWCASSAGETLLPIVKSLFGVSWQAVDCHAIQIRAAGAGNCRRTGEEFSLGLHKSNLDHRHVLDTFRQEAQEWDSSITSLQSAGLRHRSLRHKGVVSSLLLVLASNVARLVIFQRGLQVATWLIVRLGHADKKARRIRPCLCTYSDQAAQLLQFDDKIRSVNALPLDMCEFDIILGMDWLAAHRATIDCFLATIHDTTSDVSSIHDQPIVSEFQDVFPEELSRYTSYCDVEFKLSFMPGKLRLSTSSYRMAPMVLKELKYQLLECLEESHGKVIAYAYYAIKALRSVNYLLMRSRARIKYETEALLELLKDYDTNIQYHPGKANVVADALSRKWDVACQLFQNMSRADQSFGLDDDGILWQGTKLCVPEDPTLREALMTEAHSSPFSIHPVVVWYGNVVAPICSFGISRLVNVFLRVPEMIEVSNEKVAVAREKIRKRPTRRRVTPKDIAER